MSFLSRFLTPRKRPLADLWLWVTQEARQPKWYAEYGVADTVDGRFDMVALIGSLVLLRLEEQKLWQENAWLTERFVEDMEGSLLHMGIGDMVLGKHMSKLMGALGGRMGAYRTALAQPDNKLLEEALARNVWREEAPEGAAEALAPQIRALVERIANAENLLEGRI